MGAGKASGKAMRVNEQTDEGHWLVTHDLILACSGSLCVAFLSQDRKVTQLNRNTDSKPRAFFFYNSTFVV